ncbi:hypothetical protein C7C45_23120 [Micromonospora arborensis]|uniref:Uncharacterized protein n=1 Tax=Micromonospora arborensis TaxID=2116518 RepID=A0A318NXH1_9ACTN|nr:hypothetical protein [Micromonospora arborensis]PYC66798.1 hypothetical protein C7C45_23120 [Micromonospora arborensis]
MSQTTESRTDQTGAFHQLLLRMAGRLPDELIVETRRWLAEGEFVEIAQAVAFAALAGRIAVTEADAALLTDVLRAAGEDVEALAALEHSDAASQPLYGAAPVSPEVLEQYGSAVPYSIDLTVPYTGPGGMDEVDAAAVAAMASLATDAPVRALWRVWRFPSMGIQQPQARRVFLLQADDETALPGLAVKLQDVLAVAGESHPQVEAFVDPDTMPPYQRTALGFAALLWTATPGEAPLVVPVFDAVETGAEPGFDPTHPRLDQAENDRVADYLDAGVPLLITPDHAPDVLDPERPEVVPAVVRTDGRWIWTEATAYYLRSYGLAPAPDLLDEIRANDYLPPEVDAVALHRALSVLYAAATEVATADDAEVPGDAARPDEARTESVESARVH